jgi:hypothetical protein
VRSRAFIFESELIVTHAEFRKQLYYLHVNIITIIGGYRILPKTWPIFNL